MNIVPHFLTLLSSSSPFDVMVQDYIPSSMKNALQSCPLPPSIFCYLKNLINCTYCTVFFNVLSCFCFLMLDVPTGNLKIVSHDQSDSGSVCFLKADP